VDDALLKQMAAAGCWMISYGIESGDPHVLKTVRKNITLNQVKKAVSMAQKNGISVAGHFILGLPGDSTESINKTIQFSKSLNLDFAQFYCATPFPGSSLYQTAMDNQWIQAIHFEAFRQDNAVMNLPRLGPDSVNALRKKAYRSFYMNPRFFFKIIVRMRAGSIKDLIQSGFRFLKWSKS
jgi:anaerobic magnesium-protoporphyrin IX monomethyl ester cyclase